MKSKKGFTLIELLVVVLIIGILAAIALPQYQKAVGKAKYLEGYLFAQKLIRAQRMYFLANGSYAADVNALDLEFPYKSNLDGVWCNEYATRCWIRMPKSVYFEFSFFTNGTVEWRGLVSRTASANTISAQRAFLESHGGKFNPDHPNQLYYYYSMPVPQ